MITCLSLRKGCSIPRQMTVNLTSATIEHRLALWKQGDLNLLMKEVRFIQEKFVSSRKAKSIEDISRIFARIVMQGKITAAIKLLDRESSTALVMPSREVLEELEKNTSIGC